MKDFRLAVVQCASSSAGDVDENLRVMDRRLAEAAGKGARLVLFPELSLTGHGRDAADISSRSLALTDPAVRKAVALTADHSLYCCFGLYERSGGGCHNAALLAGEGVVRGVHRKVHLPPRERGAFTPGKGFDAFPLPFAKVGISICYDNEIPESHICLALAGAEVILMPAGWADHWEREDYVEPCATDEEVVDERVRWMKMMFGARSRDAGTFSALANRSGMKDAGPWRFVGKSMIFAPTGRVLSEAAAWSDDIIVADLQAAVLEQYRAMEAWALRGRRPAAYGPLVQTRDDDGQEN